MPGSECSRRRRPTEGGHFEVWEDTGGDQGAQGHEDAVFGVLREIAWGCGEGGHRRRRGGAAVCQGSGTDRRRATGALAMSKTRATRGARSTTATELVVKTTVSGTCRLGRVALVFRMGICRNGEDS